jgi:hypothetical protein
MPVCNRVLPTSPVWSCLFGSVTLPSVKPRYAQATPWFGFTPKDAPLVLPPPPTHAPVPVLRTSQPLELDEDTLAFGCVAADCTEPWRYAADAAAEAVQCDAADVRVSDGAGDAATAAAANSGRVTGVGAVAGGAGVGAAALDDSTDVMMPRTSGDTAVVIVSDALIRQAEAEAAQTAADMQTFALRMTQVSIRAARDRRRRDACLHDPFVRVGLPELDSKVDFDLSVQAALDLEAYARLHSCAVVSPTAVVPALRHQMTLYEDAVRARAYQISSRSQRDMKVRRSCVCVCLCMSRLTIGTRVCAQYVSRAMRTIDASVPSGVPRLSDPDVGCVPPSVCR